MDNPRHPNHHIAVYNGGKTASERPYYCYKCDKVGKGHNMIHFHLVNDCEGKASRSLIKSDKMNRHLVHEGTVNTEIWRRQKRIQEQERIYKDIKRQMIEDIERLRNTLNDGMNDYFTQIF